MRDPIESSAARTSSLERLAEQDLFLPGQPLDEALFKPDVHMRSAQSVPLDNPPLLDLLYGSHMIEFYESFLGGPVRPLDYTWFRAKTPTQDSATKPHCDIVYMGRGTENLYTSWTPLGDIPYEMGGLLVLGKSHLNEELKGTYGQTDVDVYCENERGAAEIIGRPRAANRELTREEMEHHPLEHRRRLFARSDRRAHRIRRPLVNRRISNERCANFLDAHAALQPRQPDQPPAYLD